MIQEFLDTGAKSAHAEFQAWRTEHQDGVFLTLGTLTGATMHGARCLHLGSGPPYFQLDDGFGSLTTNRKVCGTESELLAWAAAHAVKVKRCQHCVRDHLVDAADPALAPGGSVAAPVKSSVRSQSTGDLRDAELLDLERRRAGEAGTFDPSSLSDARQRVLAAIVRRQGQPAFRQGLLELYSGACAFSGCNVEEILDAAHIIPYGGPDTNHPQNGLLLRTDLHALFDFGLLTVDTRTMTIVVASRLAGTEYEVFSGKQIRVPSETSFWPSPAALDDHRRRAG
jgi:hypothetical protein